MSLSAGTNLGAYAILTPLGACGMGEVYRETDAKPNRDVAVKILPDSFAGRTPTTSLVSPAKRKARAALNHSNIAAVYGVEDHFEGPTVSTGSGGRPPNAACRSVPKVFPPRRWASC